MRRWFLAALLLLLAGQGGPATAAAPAIEARIEALLQAARAEAATANCERLDDSLSRILCQGSITIGVRNNYPGFAVSEQARLGATRSGYEIDVARAIASRIGVAPSFTSVNPASRIAMLKEGRLDLVLATMGHTLQRDGQVNFIRPHYYQSRTVVVGDRRLAVDTLERLRGRTICVPIANSNSAFIASYGANLLIFDNPQQIIDSLRLEICSLAAHDDTFFSQAFTDPDFAARFETKLEVATLPWGMATAAGDRLSQLLQALSIAWHADGRFLEMAKRHGIGLGFLAEQRLTWLEASCLDAEGRARPDCLLPPADTTMPGTRFAHQVELFEDWVEARIGLRLELPMLKTQQAWRLFAKGIVFSLILVAGALVSTLGFSVLFGAALCARARPVRLATRGLTTVLQCSPLVLLMFFAYAVASTLLTYSAGLALILAILMIGIYNASYASHAIAETHAALALRHPPGTPLLRQAVRGASVQLMSFLVNATKGSAIASMIGVPELLNALTDITSFTSERIMTYSLLLGFYATLVMLVVWLTRVLQRRLDGAGAAA